MYLTPKIKKAITSDLLSTLAYFSASKISGLSGLFLRLGVGLEQMVI